MFVGKKHLSVNTPLVYFVIQGYSLWIYVIVKAWATRWYTLAATRILRRWIEECPHKGVALNDGTLLVPNKVSRTKRLLIIFVMSTETG